MNHLDQLYLFKHSVLIVTCQLMPADAGHASAKGGCLPESNATFLFLNSSGDGRSSFIDGAVSEGICVSVSDQVHSDCGGIYGDWTLIRAVSRNDS
jgi:hypothetical protein